MSKIAFFDIDGTLYGFNGKENDKEVKGDGNQVVYENRIYDTRLGKWFSIDPLQDKYAPFTPYHFVQNNPIFYKDIDGRTEWVNIIINDERTGKSTQFSVPVSDKIKSHIVWHETHGEHFWEDEGGTYMEYEWNDINLNFNITIDKKGNPNVSFTETTGKLRTTTSHNFEWKAKANMFFDRLFNSSSKDPDIGEGYWLTSKEGGNGLGDPLGPGAIKVSKVDNADFMLALFSAGRLSTKPISEAFNSKDVYTSVLAFLEAYKNYLKEGKSAAYALKHTKELLEEKPENKNIKLKYYYEGIKKGTIVHPRNFPAGSNIKVITNKTGQCSSEPATDTIPYVH